MANYENQNVIGDLGSEEAAVLISSYHNLLDVMGDLITALKGAADTAAINVLATTAETALEANVRKVVSQPPVPARPRFPVP